MDDSGPPRSSKADGVPGSVRSRRTGPGTHNRENSIKIRAGAGSETLGHDPCSSPHGPMTVRSGNQAPASVTLPPAASILLLADADTLSTATVTATERSPSPSTLTGWPLRTAPA